MGYLIGNRTAVCAHRDWQEQRLARTVVATRWDPSRQAQSGARGTSLQQRKEQTCRLAQSHAE